MDDELPYYDVKNMKLSGSILSKARKFNKLRLVEERGPNEWAVKPIKGYNHTEYTVWLTPEGWKCSCQANRINHRVCSHIVAVQIYINKRR